MTTRQRLYFILAFAILLTGRLSIAGMGYLEDTDELLFMWIHLHFSEFGHINTWVRCMNDVQGQLPEIAIRLLEYISILPLASAWGQSMLHPDILYYMGLYNIVASLGLLVLFYYLLRAINFSIELSILGMLLLGTLCNFNLYTRHILPYDHSLLLQLLALLILLRRGSDLRYILLAGCCSAMGLVHYYGSFMMIFISAGFLVLSHRESITSTLAKLTLFIIPFIGVIAGVELFTRLGGGSYFQFLNYYSTTVGTAGLFDEGFSYVFTYFYLVEGSWGQVLLFMSVIGLIAVAIQQPTSVLMRLLLLALLSYLSFGGYITWCRKMNFEGRVLHLYYPFIITAVLGLVRALSLKYQKCLVAVIVLLCLVNYGRLITELNALGYPRYAIYKLNLMDNPKASLHYQFELPTGMRYDGRLRNFIDSTCPRPLASGSYTLLNFGFLIDVPDTAYHYIRYFKNPSESVIYEALHFESYPAYTMEYCTSVGRKFYLEKKFKLLLTKSTTP